jgi:hypothetical protein
MVRCKLCEKLFVRITNTHLKKEHNISHDDYLEQFPGSLITSKVLREHMSKALMGKNTGNKRPDAVKYMSKNNPMHDKKIAKKMGRSRRAGIVSGKIDAMSNFNHLPTVYEKHLIHWLKLWNIPLIYVGDGKVNIDGYCPDFINEEKKIILELELNFTKSPRNRKCKKEISYQKAGYKVIWITKMDKEYIHKWVEAAFNKFLTKPVKIKRIWTEEFHEKTKRRKFVHNLSISPNNTYIANNIVVHNCFANSFRASLYTAFFDNSKTMGLRHCNPDYYIKEMDKMAKYRTMSMKDKRQLSGINKAFALDIPLRMGIRFEDFLRNEGRHGVSLRLLEYFKDIEYPVMINTKSDLVATDDYVKALADNPAKSAVHITMITSDEVIAKKLEPGAPSYAKRLEALKILNQAGIRAIPRIEPFLFLLTDDHAHVDQYIEDILDAGATHMTFDTYSYTANNSGLRQNFINEGYDYDRMFEAGCDSQPFGSLLLSKFMDLFRARGISCSTFDMGNSPSNDQSICCEVEDWFKGGWNYGSTVMAARFIAGRKELHTSWKDYEAYVYKYGGFLTEELRMEVKHLWNLEGNVAYSHRWAAGIVPCGKDEDGLIWKLDNTDYRKNLINETL